jgi:hypothetical protein
VLASYVTPAPRSFWENFPSHYPTKTISGIKVEKLEKLISKCWDSWSVPQKQTAKKAIKRLKGEVEKPSATFF